MVTDSHENKSVNWLEYVKGLFLTKIPPPRTPRQTWWVAPWTLPWCVSLDVEWRSAPGQGGPDDITQRQNFPPVKTGKPIVTSSRNIGKGEKKGGKNKKKGGYKYKKTKKNKLQLKNKLTRRK